MCIWGPYEAERAFKLARAPRGEHFQIWRMEDVSPDLARICLATMGVKLQKSIMLGWIFSYQFLIAEYLTPFPV
jgi:hypothetical protein